jgi:hypothetical protein
MADTLAVIACPILRLGTPVGALAMLWPRELQSTADFAEVHLARLKEATASISADLEPRQSAN